MKTKNIAIIIIIIGLIIFGGIGIYTYGQIVERAYQLGVQDTKLAINQQMIESIYQSGYIPYILPINETTLINIMLVPQPYNQQVGVE